MADKDQDLFASDGGDQSKDANGGENKTVGSQDQDKLVALPDGRKVTGEQAVEEYRKLQTEFTRRTEELKELKEKSTPKTPVQEAAVLKELKEKYGVVTRDELEAERDRIRGEMEYNKKIERLEEKFDGKNGYPAFERDKVLAFMQKESLYNPDVAYREMNREAIKKAEVEEYIKAQKSNPSSISGGSTGGHTPDKKDSAKGPKTDDELIEDAKDFEFFE